LDVDIVSGFSIPYAVLGFTGKAFGKVAFNLSINAAASGGALLQQAWFDVQLKKQFAVRVGKFKTPFSHAYLTTLGETLLPQLPVSLTSAVILPYSLNAVTPNIGTGFDLGVEIHGLVADKFDFIHSYHNFKTYFKDIISYPFNIFLFEFSIDVIVVCEML
jgi:hypothetical protein